MVTYGVKQITEVISQMTSVERLIQFTSLPQEKHGGPPAPKDWPQRARLVFKDLKLRYDVESEPVLKDLNIVIESGWKVMLLELAYIESHFISIPLSSYVEFSSLIPSSNSSSPCQHLLYSYPF
jgi:hypothetical protein